MAGIWKEGFTPYPDDISLRFRAYLFDYIDVFYKFYAVIGYFLNNLILYQIRFFLLHSDHEMLGSIPV